MKRCWIYLSVAVFLTGCPVDAPDSGTIGGNAGATIHEELVELLLQHEEEVSKARVGFPKCATKRPEAIIQALTPRGEGGSRDSGDPNPVEIRGTTESKEFRDVGVPGCTGPLTLNPPSPRGLWRGRPAFLLRWKLAPTLKLRRTSRRTGRPLGTTAWQAALRQAQDKQR
jgi:hypothetical protein